MLWEHEWEEATVTSPFFGLTRWQAVTYFHDLTYEHRSFFWLLCRLLLDLFLDGQALYRVIGYRPHVSATLALAIDSRRI